MQLQDYALKPVGEGDLVFSEQGRVFRLLDTDPSIARQKCATAQEVRYSRRGGWRDVGEPQHIRLYHCFKLTEVEARGSKELLGRVTYLLYYNAFAKDRVEAEAKARRKRAHDTLRAGEVRLYE